MYSNVLCREGSCGDASYVNMYCKYNVYPVHIFINIFSILDTGRIFNLAILEVTHNSKKCGDTCNVKNMKFVAFS